MPTRAPRMKYMSRTSCEGVRVPRMKYTVAWLLRAKEARLVRIGGLADCGFVLGTPTRRCMDSNRHTHRNTPSAPTLAAMDVSEDLVLTPPSEDDEARLQIHSVGLSS